MTKEQVVAEIRVEAWADCPSGVSLIEFRDYLTTLGNSILEIDYDNSRIKVCDYTAPQTLTYLQIKEIYDGATGQRRREPRATDNGRANVQHS